MKTLTKLAIAASAAAITLAGVSASFADQRAGAENRGGPRGGMMRMISAADADNSGTFTREEVSAFVAERFAGADADGNGTVTAEELSAAIAEQSRNRRAERAADRMLERLDINEDGSVSLDEVVQRQEAFFAFVDIDGSGVIEADELRQRGERGGRQMRGEGGRGGNNAQ